MKLYLNDLGIINALGNNKAEVVNRLFQGSQKNISLYEKLFTKKQTYVAEINAQLSTLPSSFEVFDCRNNRLLVETVRQIAPMIDQLKALYGSTRIGIVLGTSTSGISKGESDYNYFQTHQHFPKSFDYKQQELGQIALFLSHYTEVYGPTYTISTACSSSAKAVIAAARLIQNNFCDAVIVGGCDTLCQMTLNGFDCIDSVSDRICNPFSANRNGITIGEGAALFILSKKPSEIELVGFGESSDGYHITSPDPEGNGAKLSMSAALDSAHLKAGDIGYINAHGTATPKNDQMESKAIYDLFTDQVPVSSTKPLTGHTLGAAASIELGLCWLLLSEKYNLQKIIPKQLWDGIKGEDISNCYIINEQITYDRSYFLSNSFAFGGNNASLIIGRGD
ncbi:beta-ketoacyl-[acyl-carrier-protein] synthase family protein [Thiotrichales bacterium 19S3-7]|nr:beta-ketoacyl-[acyl-carrier-protein] synthase family protein [Thiotrichales bacterium 19S3-7]MCF6800675.1 beta-ketoacyl-[acyl-carrier-protein] synthase family protein [Thiotrichales bacterium 19S3-11]